MPAPALRGGHGQSRSGHGRSMKNSYLCAPRLGVSVKGCQPFASDVPDSRRAALFDLPDLKVKEFHIHARCRCCNFSPRRVGRNSTLGEVRKCLN